MSDEGAGGGEKTHEPTAKKLQDARKRGEVAKSDEVTTAAVYLGVIVGGAITAGNMFDQAGLGMAVFLDRADQLGPIVLGHGGAGRTLAILGQALAGLGPILLVPAIFAIVTLVAQRAIAVSGQKLAPKLSRISPISGFKNKFGPTGLMEFVKRVVKLGTVAVIVLYLGYTEHARVLGAPAGTPAAQVRLMFELLGQLLISVAVVACAIAALDLAWVQFDHRRKNKMSLQELRDETKEAEGDPTFKGKRRRKAVEIATGQMLSDVAKADVVIVNPTHYAVALRWSREAGTAPVCVAKGVDMLARRMREIAEDNKVPIHSDPPTARALHALVEIGDEVPAEHYRAVAAAIRFAEDMRRRMRERNGPGS